MILRIVFLLVLACWYSAAMAAPPKLVVMILVDQMAADYVDRFSHRFGPGGLKLLAQEGAVMTFARYNFAQTITAPGHATFVTGATPALHGIIANEWWDKAAGKRLYCVDDPSVQSVGTTSDKGKMSPRNLVGATVADQLRLHYRSKVVSASMKDRGAILPGGKRPTGAYWFEAKTGKFITSTYYTPSLPAWVRTYNERKRPADFAKVNWERLFPEDSYAYPDVRPAEGKLVGGTNAFFPHTVYFSEKDGFESIMATPFSNEILFEFGIASLDGEGLGKGTAPDLLCLSFSAVDYCGHRFGPYSQETEDMMIRFDQQMANFLKQIDRRIGLRNTIITLTADHGIGLIPEDAAEQGMGGKRIKEADLLKGLVKELEARFGTADILASRTNFFDNSIYFNDKVLKEKSIQARDAALFVRDWALGTGVFHAGYTREQILDGRTPGFIGELIHNGFYPERSGDLVMVKKPFVISSTEVTGTTHGSPYHYDSNVPVIFFGAPFKKGRYADEFYVTDLAPTLCAALRVQAPAGCVGKPFAPILRNP